MSITLPPLPAYPATAGPERDEWHRLARLHTDAASIAAQNARAAAEQAVAAAGVAAAQAQQAAATAISAPVQEGKPTKALLVLQELGRMQHLTGMTDLQQVDIAIKRVDAWLQRFPGAAT